MLWNKKLCQCLGSWGMLVRVGVWCVVSCGAVWWWGWSGEKIARKMVRKRWMCPGVWDWNNEYDGKSTVNVFSCCFVILFVFVCVLLFCACILTCMCMQGSLYVPCVYVCLRCLRVRACMRVRRVGQSRCKQINAYGNVAGKQGGRAAAAEALLRRPVFSSWAALPPAVTAHLWGRFCEGPFWFWDFVLLSFCSHLSFSFLLFLCFLFFYSGFRVTEDDSCS